MRWTTVLGGLVLGVAGAGVLSAGGCSGSGVTGTAPPQAILSGTFVQSGDNSCTLAGQSIGFGAFDAGTANPTPVRSGEGSPIGTIGVECRVHVDGKNKWLADGTMTANGQTIFTIHGDVAPYTPPDGGIFGILASLSANGATYSQQDGGCFITYTNSAEGVAGARVWGIVTCPNAHLVGGTGTCGVVAEFRFENCAF